MYDAAGCFSGQLGRVIEPVGIDGLELGVTQSLTPALLLSLTGFYQHLGGFQSNPYRSVRVAGLGDSLELHPRTRHRGAVAAQARWAPNDHGGALVGVATGAPPEAAPRLDEALRRIAARERELRPPR